jgi:hypothetical protein
MSSKGIILCLIAWSVSSILSAQDKTPVKFGNVTPKDFATTVYPIDSNAQAVVIADVGYTFMEGNNKNSISVVTKHYKRVHILNKNAFDVASESISFYKSGDVEEELDKLKAVTYNLENGKVVETKLDTKNGVFKETVNKNRFVKKFTLPNIKEGCIIEFEYTVRSDFFWQLDPWMFQGPYPILWSEYNLEMPEFLGYTFLSRGYKKYDITDKKTRSTSFTITDSRGTGASERGQFSTNVTDHRWVIKNVPALKEENFTSTLSNHITRLEFQLAELRPPYAYKNFIQSWSKVTTDLLRNESFGEKIARDNGWLDEYTNPLVLGAKSDLEKARRIYYYVRDNFTCTNYSDFYADQSLKNIVKTKKGTVAEINLLLTAMLKHERITADPVMLSTRSHGQTYELYPLMTQYNYVVVKADIGTASYFMDATEPRLGFGHLPVRCYNGHARVVNQTADPVYFTPDTLLERSSTSVFMINDEKGNMVGSLNRVPGYFESFSLREKVNEKGKEALETEVKKSFAQEVAIAKFKLDSLNKPEELVWMSYDFDILDPKEDIIYFNPLLASEGYKENPFKSAERFYPVEMPYGFDRAYNLQMEVPEGYVVDELPKSMVVKMNEAEEGMFEYRISQSGTSISFRCRIQLKRAYFDPEEYEMLREFFNMIVAKESEQIVFKKKK